MPGLLVLDDDAVSQRLSDAVDDGRGSEKIRRSRRLHAADLDVRDRAASHGGEGSGSNDGR